MSNDSPAVCLYDSLGNALVTSSTPTQGTELGLIVRPVGANIDGQKASYSAAVTALSPASATPTDIFTLYGSSTKTTRVTRFCITGTQTTAAVRDILLLRRTTPNSGGTSATVPAIPHDSVSAASTCICTSYTGNPSSLGTLLGTVRNHKLFVGTTGGVGATDQVVWDFGVRPTQAMVVRGSGQGLCVNLNSVASSGALFNIIVEWSEE